MIFNDGSIDPVTFQSANKLKWKLGILNLKPSHERVDNVRNQAFPGHHFDTQKAFEQVFSLSYETVMKIVENTPIYKVRASPTILRRSIKFYQEKRMFGDKSVSAG